MKLKSRWCPSPDYVPIWLNWTGLQVSKRIGPRRRKLVLIVVSLLTTSVCLFLWYLTIHLAPTESSPSEIRYVEFDGGHSWDMHQPATLDNESRRGAIIEAIQHSWKGYRERAFGADEVWPVNGGNDSHFGGVQVTLVDSLGTLFLAGLMDEFEEAVTVIEARKPRPDVCVSFFETTIRVLGGLLSAYDLSGDGRLLSATVSLADALLPAFATRSGLPSRYINLSTASRASCLQEQGAKTWKRMFWQRFVHFITEIVGYSFNSLAGVGSCQLELLHLSQVTGDDRYASAALRVYEILSKLPRNRRVPKGLFPSKVNLSGGFAASEIGLGGQSDSFYEYLLKVFLLTGRRDALDLYIQAVDAILEHLLVEFETPAGVRRARLRGLSAGDVTFNTERMEHLACFTPGMLALGAWYGERNGIKELRLRANVHMAAAHFLTETCMDMYRSTPTGLAPEMVTGFDTKDGRFELAGPRHYSLRPETVETLFIMWRVTGDPAFRDKAWQIFVNINQHCRAKFGFSGIKDVTDGGMEMGTHDGRKVLVRKTNYMPSYFLAETLKYLLLIFSDEDLLPLDRYVLNTEAHPFLIPARRDTP